jgi:hypothetical protein
MNETSVFPSTEFRVLDMFDNRERNAKVAGRVGPPGRPQHGAPGGRALPLDSRLAEQE